MPRPALYHRDRINLIAFLALLVFGGVLITAGVPAASLIVVTAGLTQLYAAFRTGRTQDAHTLIERQTQTSPAITPDPHTSADAGVPDRPDTPDASTP